MTHKYFISINTITPGLTKYLFLLIFLEFSILLSAQQIVRVPNDYSTIQSAIFNSNAFDTIIISEGTYYENLLIRDKTLILGSKYLLTGDTSYISKTVIDGQNHSAVIRIDGEIGEQTTITGLTIQNGDDGILSFAKFNLIRNHIHNCIDALDYENNSGGLCLNNIIELNSDDAIDLDSTISIVIENNILRNNTDDGIEIRFHRYSGPSVEYKIISNQIYNNGEDGIQIIGDNVLTNRILYIDNNLISDNHMAGIGSMALMNTVENYEGSDIEELIILTNNTITNNNHGVTGSDNMILLNNIISYNEVAGIKNIDGNSRVQYTNLWQNGNDLINCNIDSSSAIFEDPIIDSSFSLGFCSPCIDAGIAFYAIENDTIFKSSKEIFGNEIDIGAIEYDPGILIKGPYLTYQNIDSEILLSWQLKSTATCTLKWGRSQSDYSDSWLTTENSSDTLEHIHSHSIDNLTPGVKYYYLIEGNELKLSGTFLSPPANSERKVSFYSLGDSRSAIQIFDSIASRILNEISLDTLSQSFILHTGDWTTTGSEDDWQNDFFNRWYSSNLKLQSMVAYAGVRGSHENFYDPDASVYTKYFRFNYESPEEGLYYSFDYGPVHISVIDQYLPYDTASIQYSWLVDDLNTSEKKWKIIAFHEPGYSDGGHADNEDVQRFIQPLCDKYNVLLILAGHNHFYSRNKINNTHHLTLGGGGAPLYEPNNASEGLIYSEKSFHFAKIDIEDDEMSVRIIKPDGSIIDTFTIRLNTSSVRPLRDEVRIYPNPCRNHVTIEGLDHLSTDKYILEVQSVSGKILMQEDINTNKIQMDMSELEQGFYFIVLKNRQKSNYYRIIKI